MGMPVSKGPGILPAGRTPVQRNRAATPPIPVLMHAESAAPLRKKLRLTGASARFPGNIGRASRNAAPACAWKRAALHERRGGRRFPRPVAETCSSPAASGPQAAPQRLEASSRQGTCVFPASPCRDFCGPVSHVRRVRYQGTGLCRAGKVLPSAAAGAWACVVVHFRASGVLQAWQGSLPCAGG